VHTRSVEDIDATKSEAVQGALGDDIEMEIVDTGTNDIETNTIETIDIIAAEVQIQEIIRIKNLDVHMMIWNE